MNSSCNKINNGNAISAIVNWILKNSRKMNSIGRLNRKLNRFESTWMVGNTSEAKYTFRISPALLIIEAVDSINEVENQIQGSNPQSRNAV